jgi:hypothetical protein
VKLLSLALLACLLTACLPPATPAPTPVVPTPLPTPLPSPTPDPTDSGWVRLSPGLEQRLIDLYEEGVQVDHLLLVRLDPAAFRFEVAYTPDRPLLLEDWQIQTGAMLVVNGGYFRIEEQRYLPAGLLVVDEQFYGESYTGFGGMFAVTPWEIQLRSLSEWPVQPGESLLYALQSFPVLVKPGGVLGFPVEYEDGIRARRTVIGRDRSGRLVFLVASRSYFTLHMLSLYLLGSDLDLDIALNLDGGPSTGMLISGSQASIPALSELPIVIAAFPGR